MNKKELKESLQFWRVQLKDLPRKKKKVAKKSALLLYAMACYEDNLFK